MKAMVIHEYGGPEVLRAEDLPVPVPADGEVLVRVRAVSVNPVDYKRRRSWAAQPLPVVLGWDVSGVVEALGPDVADFRVGDEVFGMVRFPAEGRAYAEYVSAPVSDIARKPPELTHAQAAAMTLAALTAEQALEALALRAGQTILIHAAAGGVGHFAVQLAHTRGARVIATASARNIDFVRGLGADEIVDYHARPFEEQVSGVDAVFDTVGGDTLPRSFGVLRPGGRLVAIAGQPDEALARQHGVHAERILVHPSRPQLEFLAAEAAAGRVVPHVSQTFPLDRVADAHRALETGRTVGKIVLEPVP
ncbi:NADPH:quinone reductase-like Zn-dependent oxidoreductase [Deinococcus metalli]|uniref:NADPH:quinone reductase n=1 Tax=Deinococcus metalli TaxID=1141878 RepID=A0A7W8KGT7_9DEIO|nr:NADP-dependent oxidoreductase [Deinococcus metalli]MBB5377533.1 NADPH:quinone reductase-like Zn-dependent oxidoreductase [Deinococcus metalli]GHF51165.1 NADPH:quinone reductase [Deinococcus metalli]